MKKSVGDTASKPKDSTNDIGPITGWDSFFGACGRARPHLERYEGCVRSWFSLMGNSAEADSRHESSFWKSYRAFSKPVILGIVKVAGIVAGVVAVLVVLLSALTSFLDLGAFGLAVLGDAYGAGILAATTWTRALTVALVLGLVSAAVAVGAHMLRKTLLEREMASCEETLHDYVSYMPPKYRNAFCADAFYEMWTAYGVGDINQAIDVCDEHIANNRGRYRAIQLMSDVPYVGAGSSKVHFAERERSWDEPDDSNPDLPDDIASHLSEGVPDAEEALNSLIGLENVKKQVRTMRNRIDFYGDETKRLSGNHMVFMGSAGSGKALDNTTPIPVADERGYVPIGDLRVGDVVFDDKGQPTEVLGVYPQGVLPAWEVRFADGSTLVCNEEHMFGVRRLKAHRFHGPYVDMNVHQMLEEGVLSKAGGKREKYKFFIPVGGALQRDDVELPLDPYALGALIGDGCLTSKSALEMSSADKDVVAEVARCLGAEPYKLPYNNYTWAFYCGSPEKTMHKNLLSARYVSLRYMLNTTGLDCVFGKKSPDRRIPEVYFTGSEQQRLRLLQGLMDTDGTVTSDERMRVMFTTHSKGLAEDVACLVTSLGMRANVRSVDRGKYRPSGKVEYVVNIRCPFAKRSSLFLFSPKKERCEAMYARRQENMQFPDKPYEDMGIVDIRKLDEDVPMTCIYVAADSHLYQAGKRHVVTHNTSVARIITRILYDYGYIHANRIVEIDGDYLKSTYVGGTGKRTQAIVDYAAGGVLFIDEAYLLFDAKASGSAGTEATGVLLKAMEDMRDDIVVIMAGYEDPMTRLIASNEGFASRIRHRFYFEDYTTDELMQIFDLFLSKSSGNHTYEVDDHARELVRSYFDAERGRAGFGGARAVRNAVDAIMDIHADNFIAGDGDERDRWRITAADGERFAEQMRELAGADSRNMMAAMHIDESIISASELKQHTHEAPADVTSELASLVGLESAKAELEALRAQSEFWAGKGVAMGHMAFLGAPGTAKSTMAGIVTACLHDMGYIRDRRYVDVNGDFFRGAYVGHTGKRTSATIEYATGGVLFIDEAYLLSPTGSQDTFGAEALGVLVDAMEKKRGQLVVILAGYTEDMERLFSVNVGLRSRISTILHFESYSLKQLCQIFAVMARSQDFACDDALYGPLSRHLRVAMADPQFGNGRYVRELLADVIKEHIMRVSRGETSERMVLDSADVEAAVAKRG